MDNANPNQSVQETPQADFSQNIKTNPYFISLPPYIQETVLQSGVKIESEQQLRQIVQNINNQYNNKNAQ